MASRWSSRLAVWLLPILGAAAVPRLAAQRVRELGVQAVFTAADEATFVAGPLIAIRPSPRARLSLGTGVGISEETLAWRAELLGHFLLNPARRRGFGLYGAAGVAASAGPFERGYIVLALGMESRPGTRSGWTVEAGVGGGVRFAAGYRWRRSVPP